MRSERLLGIEQYLYEKKTVTLDELCHVFDVSKNTIRRDIEVLVENPNIKKIYGGITVDGAAPRGLISYERRNFVNTPSKTSIAKEAARFIEDGDIIFIDSGTTTARMLEFIKDKEITILTNNLEIIYGAIPYDNLTIITLSGVLRRDTLSFTGISATKTLEAYNIPKAFFAATGFSLSGATNSSAEETAIKQMAIARSVQRFLLADHTKYDVVSLLTYGELADFQCLITDQEPPDSLCEELKKLDTQVIIAKH